MTEKSISLGDNSIIIRQLKSVIGQFGRDRILLMKEQNFAKHNNSHSGKDSHR